MGSSARLQQSKLTRGTKPGGQVRLACSRESGPGRLGVSEQSCYRWLWEYGGLKVDQARRLKELEQENTRLKRAVADLTPDKLNLKEASFRHRVPM